MLGVLIQVTLNTTKLKLMKNLQFAIYGRTIRQHSPWELAHCPDRAALSWMPGECNFECSRKIFSITDAILMRSIGLEKKILMKCDPGPQNQS